MRSSRAALLACAAFFAGPEPAAAEFRPDVASLTSVPRLEVPAALLQKALEEPVKGRPYQFAVPVELALAPEQGLWLAYGGQRSWRLRLHSPGARSLSLQFTQPTLPQGSTLWIYDPRARLTHGPFDASRVGASGLWTPAVGGDELVVEIRTTAASMDAIRLGTVRAFHGFRDWKGGAPAKAGACNIDITCPAAAEWTQDGSAVARISIGGAFLCSGQLLNNVRQDQRRLFLTANHCGVDGDSGPAASVVFYFNYVGLCNDGIDNPVPAPTFQGAQRLAHDAESDFALLLITNNITPLPAGVHFAGWDAMGAGSGSGASIHHPSGDEKKIAFHTSALTADTIDVGSGCPIAAWRVQWSSGTTEGGSSGAGLWNASHRLIGVLSGGLASCLNPGGFDYFGRLDRGWTASAATNGQLKAHLDPDNSCVAIVPPLDPATTPGPVPPTMQNMRCSGPASSCGRRSSGGGAPGALTLVVLGLAAAVRRRSGPDHQQDAGDRQR